MTVQFRRETINHKVDHIQCDLVVIFGETSRTAQNPVGSYIKDDEIDFPAKVFNCRFPYFASNNTRIKTFQ